MSSIWEFLKRHRGKLVLGGVVVGGAVALHSAVQNMQRQQHLLDLDPLRIQARRHYVYDTNQRACDKTILDLAECIAKRIALKLDVESAIEALRQQPPMPDAEKIIHWNKIKVMAFSRVVAVAYSFSLLTVALKCQISIMASFICESFDIPDEHACWWTKYMSEYFGTSSDEHAHTTINSNAQQLFLRCIQFFTTQGVEELVDRTQAICADELEEVSLKEEMDSNRLTALVDNIKRRMQSIDTRHFSYLVVPKFANQDAFALPHSGDLQALLHRLVEMLESNKCKTASSALLDYYFQAALHFVDQHSSAERMALARVIPLMADCYPTVSGCGIDSPLHNSLCSSHLYALSMHAFSLPPPKSMSNSSVQ